jgi:hypothetical protein
MKDQKIKKGQPEESNSMLMDKHTHTERTNKHPHTDTHDLPQGVCASVLLRNLDRPV